MVLPADHEPPLGVARRGGERRLGLADPERHPFDRKRAARGQRLHRVEDEGRVVIVDLGQRRGPARGLARLGDHREDGLAVKHHPTLGKDRVVAPPDRAHVVAPRDVGGGQHPHHPRRGPHRVEVHAPDRPVRHGSEAQGRVQRALGDRQVVGIVGPPGDVQRGGFVRHVAAGRDLGVRGALVHHPASATARSSRTGTAIPACSSQNRRKKLAATACR